LLRIGFKINIVIVGGGTAGWISAFLIFSFYKNIHNITLIESKKIGSIGVGEASTGFLRGITNNEVYNFNCNEFDFMKKTNALPKLGVYFKDWQKNKNFFEPISGAIENNYHDSYPLLLKYISEKKPIHLSSYDGIMVENNISSFHEMNNCVYSTNRHAYHFDAKLAAEYFKNMCVDKIKIIENDIVDIFLKENGEVEYLLLKDNKKVYGDFFIDASGFHRIFAKKMKIKYVKKEELTLNSAIPFFLEHKDVNKINFYTTAWAQKYGWMWSFPKQNHIACGYIFDNNFIDFDGAKKEIENILKKEINVVKEIKFEAGHLEKAWNKNVLSVGLSSLFLEPLEATSIHGLIAQIYYFIFYYLKTSKNDTINEFSIKKYNEYFLNMSNNFKLFVLSHYLNVRNDTDFWKNMNFNAKNNPFIKEFLEIFKFRLLNDFDFNNPYGGSPHVLFNWTYANLNIINCEIAKKELNLFNRKNQAEIINKNMKEYINSKKWLTNEDFFNMIKYT
jgi:hypothetical protein